MSELSHAGFAFGALGEDNLPGDALLGSPLFLHALAASAIPVVAISADHSIQFANTALCRLGHLAPGQNPVGNLFEAVFPEITGPGISSDAALLHWKQSRAGGWFGLGCDKSLRAGLDRAHTDDLTGLGNRTYLRIRTQQQMKDQSAGLVLICVDLDNFKLINDTLGHAAGDILLKKAAQRMKNALRSGDLVVRMGGDEFVVVLRQPVERDVPQAIADRIVNYLSRPFMLDGQQMQVGASIGIAETLPGEEEISGALRRADIALYASKSAGRGQWRWYQQEMSHELERRRQLEADLRRAIRRDELNVLYQPQMEIAGNKIRALEALVRWEHPKHGLLPPSDFLPIAETSGLIHDLGAWVMKRACLEASKWPTHIKVSVNISAVQLQHKDFVDLVGRVLEVTGVPPTRLELEVKETSLMQHGLPILAQIALLKGKGISVALDDFGASYSKLHTLKDFPFDLVKVDHSYVQPENFSKADQALLCSITGLGKQFGNGVLAERVETQAQLEAVRQGGAGSVQGYIFAPPLRPEQIAEFLERHSDL